MKIGGRLHRFWGRYAELGYWLPEEKPRWWPMRLNEWMGNLTDFPPMWPWRIACWHWGHVDNSYGSCCVCRKRLG